jgi:hypothetical protein
MVDFLITQEEDDALVILSQALIYLLVVITTTRLQYVSVMDQNDDKKIPVCLILEE